MVGCCGMPMILSNQNNWKASAVRGITQTCPVSALQPAHDMSRAKHMVSLRLVGDSGGDIEHDDCALTCPRLKRSTDMFHVLMLSKVHARPPVALHSRLCEGCERNGPSVLWRYIKLQYTNTQRHACTSSKHSRVNPET